MAKIELIGKEIYVNGHSVKAANIYAVGDDDLSNEELQFVIKSDYDGWILPIDLDEAIEIVMFEKGISYKDAKDYLFEDDTVIYGTLWELAISGTPEILKK